MQTTLENLKMPDSKEVPRLPKLTQKLEVETLSAEILEMQRIYKKEALKE